MFKKKRQKLNEDLPENVVRRAGMIPSYDLMDWAENTLRSIDDNLHTVRRNPSGPDSAYFYGEAIQSSEALLAILREIAKRTKTDLAPTPPQPQAAITDIPKQR